MHAKNDTSAGVKASHKGIFYYYVVFDCKTVWFLQIWQSLLNDDNWTSFSSIHLVVFSALKLNINYFPRS